LNKARDALGVDRVSALMTTTTRSLDKPREIIDEYLRLGFDGIFLRALSPYGFAVKTKQFLAYDTQAWLDFYFEGLEYILELNRKGVEFTEFFAATILTKMLSSNEPGFVDLMNPAGIGIAGIVYNYDGNVYASDESRMLAEMHDHTFKLGNLEQDSYEEIMLSDALLDNLEQSFTLSAPMCSDCAFEPYCGSDPVFHHALYGDPLGRKSESAFCERNIKIFKYLINKMTSDEMAHKTFLRWAKTC
jgi:His-Xaa-Ser system radical SAM maturase HxsB